MDAESSYVRLNIPADLWRCIIDYAGPYRLVLRMTCRYMRGLIPAPRLPSWRHVSASPNIALIREMCLRGDAYLLAWWVFYLPSCMEVIDRWSDHVVEGGNAAILRWALRQHRFIWSPHCTIRAAEAGRIDLLEMARQRGKASIILVDITCGMNLEALRWFRDKCHERAIPVSRRHMETCLSLAMTQPDNRERVALLNSWLSEST
jgi:hypothetical protein